MVNSVLNWCIDLASKNEMSRTKFNKFDRLLGQYIAGRLKFDKLPDEPHKNNEDSN